MTSISHNQRLNLHFFEPSVGILTLHFKFILPLMSAWGGYLQFPHLDQAVISGYLVPGRQSRENLSAFLKNDLFFFVFKERKPRPLGVILNYVSLSIRTRFCFNFFFPQIGRSQSWIPSAHQIPLPTPTHPRQRDYLLTPPKGQTGGWRWPTSRSSLSTFDGWTRSTFETGYQHQSYHITPRLA